MERVRFDHPKERIMIRWLTGASFLAAFLLALSTAGADDKVESKKTPALEGLFKRLDANKDGKLSKEEFKQLAELGQGRLKDKPELVDKLFEKLDADGDGFVTLEEFKKLAELREKFQEKKKEKQ